MARAKQPLTEKAKMVKYGYGQVEGNKLSARYNGQVYAQLPANKDIEVLENGMFAKYDYAKHEVNFTGPGDWLLVFNEVKVYRDLETDADFAMLKDNYTAIVYNATGDDKYSHYGLGGTDQLEELSGDQNGMMPEETTMVPRLLGTRVGDIMTTNTIANTYEEINVEDYLNVGADGYLVKGSLQDNEMTWQVVQKYTMPDLQPGVKIIRVR